MGSFILARAPGDPNDGPSNIAVVVVLLVLSGLVVTLRMVIKTCLVKKIGWDDWTIVFAMLGTAIGSGLDFVEVHYGFGRMENTLNDNQIQEFLKYSYGEWIQTFATLMWTKVSICLLLLHVPTSKAIIRTLRCSIGLLVISNVVLTLLWIFQCHPIHRYWNPHRDVAGVFVPGRCFSNAAVLNIIIAQALISAVSDFVLASYPILILWKVQLNLKTKVGLCCMMGLGVLTGVCCVVRTVLNYQSLPMDATYGGITNWYWRSFEVNVGIITACIPTLRPGYGWMFKRLRAMKKARDHLPLAEIPLTSPFDSDTKVARPSNPYTGGVSPTVLTYVWNNDVRAPDGRIKKTTQVDVEHFEQC